MWKAFIFWKKNPNPVYHPEHAILTVRPDGGSIMLQEGLF